MAESHITLLLLLRQRKNNYILHQDSNPGNARVQITKIRMFPRITVEWPAEAG